MPANNLLMSPAAAVMVLEFSHLLVVTVSVRGMEGMIRVSLRLMGRYMTGINALINCPSRARTVHFA